MSAYVLLNLENENLSLFRNNFLNSIIQEQNVRFYLSYDPKTT